MKRPPLVTNSIPPKKARLGSTVTIKLGSNVSIRDDAFLSVIFSLLSRPRDVCACYLVNKQWARVIDENETLKTTKNNFTWSLMSGLWRGVLLNTQGKPSWVVFIQMNFDIPGTLTGNGYQIQAQSLLDTSENTYTKPLSKQTKIFPIYLRPSEIKPGNYSEFEIKWICSIRAHPRVQYFSLPSVKFSRTKLNGQFMFFLDVELSSKEFYPEDKGSFHFVKYQQDTSDVLQYMKELKAKKTATIDLAEILPEMPKSP